MSRLMQEKRREGQRQGMLPADRAQDGKHTSYVDEHCSLNKEKTKFG